LIVDLDALASGLPTHAFEELVRDSERFAAPAGYSGPRSGAATVTNLTAPTAPSSFIFPLLGVVLAAVLALVVGLAIVFKVRGDAAAAQGQQVQASATGVVNVNSGLPQVSAPTRSNESLVDVSVTLDPKAASVREGDADIPVVGGVVMLRVKRDAATKLKISAPGYVTREVSVNGVAPNVAFKLEPLRTTATARSAPALVPSPTVAAPTVKAGDTEASCRAKHRHWDGFGCL
jgi:hypothetical protein